MEVHSSKNQAFRGYAVNAAPFLVGSSWFDSAHQPHPPRTPSAPLQSLPQKNYSFTNKAVVLHPFLKGKLNNKLFVSVITPPSGYVSIKLL